MALHPTLAAVTARIIERSKPTRETYLDRIREARQSPVPRSKLGCANLAHAFAACGPTDKARLAAGDAPNIGIVTAYNDMLSAHQPYERYPEIIRQAARAQGATAQVAGGVPAMCDGVTQGEAGMELSLFSRDTIALGVGVALSHQTFDAALFLGICDKIVPGLVMGALAFGHLPCVFVPSGPMESGLPNDEKSRIRQLYTEGKIGRAELLASEMQSYHGPGTCTFYGTANTNQMLMEIMGLHLPGSSFVPPSSGLRQALTEAAVEQALALHRESVGLADILDEKAFVNGMAGLMATGGSTNLTIHMIAMAAQAGIVLDWSDFSAIASAVPLLVRAYPNGKADVNAFHAAGGMGFLMQQMRQAGFLHEDVTTVTGRGLEAYAQEPVLDNGTLAHRPVPGASLDEGVLRAAANPFQPQGGLALLTGALGQAVIKTSAVDPSRHVIEAPVKIFDSQEAMQEAFKAGELTGDLIAVVRYQGPKANGMPELHKLMPVLGILQDRGQKVALVTDGRLSGASGKVPCAIHLTPEAAEGGPIARLREGDVLRLDAVSGTLSVVGGEAAVLARPAAAPAKPIKAYGAGREMFGLFRRAVSAADKGASVIDPGL